MSSAAVHQRGKWGLSRRALGSLLEDVSVDLGTQHRTAWLARAAKTPGPLLVACHGLGMDGANLAATTGLAERGLAAGISVVFPDALGGVWDAANHAGRPGISDPRFIAALVTRLVEAGVTSPDRVVLLGTSNGAQFAEYTARHAALELAGIVLVIGTTLEATRASTPRPRRPIAFLCFEGTADRQMPYEGGPMGGPSLLGRWAARRFRRIGIDAALRVAVGVPALVGDWRVANQQSGEPTVEQFPDERPGLSVTRLSWTEASGPPVVLYRIEGGGHCWPGGPQYVPARLVGKVARSLDATGEILTFTNRVAAGSSV